MRAAARELGAVLTRGPTSHPPPQRTRAGLSLHRASPRSRASWFAWLRSAVFTCLALWLTVAPTASVQAQGAPADMETATGLEIPPAPEGFVRVDRGSVRWEFPERARGLVEPLFATWDTAEPRIRRELGLEAPLPDIRIRVGIDPEQMQALAPAEAPPPGYAVGVAYPGLSLILLTLTAPDTWQRPELHQVLVHELSHIALHRALVDDEGHSAHDAPLWLIEGVAIYQAREQSIERVQTLWEAAFRGGVIPLDDLDRRFPSRPHAVSLAYAQSADFVAWLLRRSGPEKLGEMLGRMRRGQRFETAVSQTWSAGIGALELQWRDDLSNRFGALPMFATGGAGWVIAGILVVLAWRRRKTRVSVIEQRWAEEDARAEQMALALARHRARLLARERALALAEAGFSASDAVDTDMAPRVGETEPDDVGRTGGALVTTTQHEKPTTMFVVGSSSTSTTSGPPKPPPVEQPQPAAPFDDDVDRGERPLH